MLSAAERSRRLREKRRNEGKCVACGKNDPEADSTRCTTCNTKHSQDSKRRHGDRRASGLCYCGTAVVPGFLTCEPHKSAASERYSERAKTGCARCGKPSDQRQCGDCRLLSAIANKKSRAKLRDETYARYGGECACCGEKEPLFLSIDHIDNDGAAHREASKYGKQFTSERIYRWLRDNSYPPGFQVMCMNCNIGKERNGGVCPHEHARRNSSVSQGEGCHEGCGPTPCSTMEQKQDFHT